MPVLFVGHGSPMNAIEENRFSLGWRSAAQALPKPEAILCISAHWETRGTQVTAMEKPRTIHDFGGFPPELYAVEYPAPGSPRLAQQVIAALKPANTAPDQHWGLDHGCWSVLRQMYPAADIPVVQLSLDYTLEPQQHYTLAKRLLPLRQQGVLLLGSGNIVHNLRLVQLQGSDFNAPFGLKWALEASSLIKKLIDSGDHHSLANYSALGRSVALAIPTPEHYLPLLYILALQQAGETVTYFNDQAVAGSLTMTSLVIH